MRIENITKTFNNTEIVALKDINLEIKKGSIHGLLGNNGSGKTTLIKCIVNLLVPDSGKIYYKNKNILNDKKTRIDNITVLLDGGRNLYLYMTVKENIKYFTMLHGITDYRTSTKYKLILEYLEIEEILNKKISNLSFGMKQRAALATALLCNVEFIILDEPTTGLDIHYQDRFSKLLIELQRNFDITILVSSHDMNFISKTCEYCTLLNDGIKIKSGGIDEFLDIFENNNYTLFYKGEIKDKDINELKTEFENIKINKDNKTINIIWNKENTLIDMFKILDEKNIYIIDIIKNNDLKDSIIYLTEEVN